MLSSSLDLSDLANSRCSQMEKAAVLATSNLKVQKLLRKPLMRAETSSSMANQPRYLPIKSVRSVKVEMKRSSSISLSRNFPPELMTPSLKRCSKSLARLHQPMFNAILTIPFLRIMAMSASKSLNLQLLLSRR